MALDAAALYPATRWNSLVHAVPLGKLANSREHCCAELNCRTWQESTLGRLSAKRTTNQARRCFAGPARIRNAKSTGTPKRRSRDAAKCRPMDGWRQTTRSMELASSLRRWHGRSSGTAVPVQLPDVVRHFNEVHPHAALGYKSPRMFRKERRRQALVTDANYASGCVREKRNKIRQLSRFGNVEVNVISDPACQ